jgi:quercetin dioxygenase-like cupin family protein
MTLPQRSVLRGAADAETVSLLGGLYRYRAVGDDTANGYSLFEVTGPQGFASPLHVHAHEAEGFYVIDGEVTLFLGDEQRASGPGTFGLAPPNSRHTFRFDSPDVRLLLLISPGNVGHEALFREMGSPAGADSTTAPESPDFEQLARIAARHGTTIVGPPPAPK